MPFTPIAILWMWLRGLLAVAILAGGVYLTIQGYRHARVWVPVGVASPKPGDPGSRERNRQGPIGRDTDGRWVFSWEPGANRETGELMAGLALLTLALAGRPLTQGLATLLLRKGADDPKPTRDGTVQRLRRPDGSELQVEFYGPPDAPPIILSHGWGANAAEWYYEKKHLADRFRLVVWDEPGLGLSRKPDNDDYSLENLARHLDAVLALCGGRPAVLVGHSIGGMITLTFCRLFPEALGSRVAGLVLVHTTPTNPVRTTKGAAIYSALEKPVLVPLLRLTIALWPLVWAMNWLSYLNGSAHRSTHRESFAGTETRGQLDFTARFMPHGRPDVLARGMLGMIHYDATATLPTISVPTLVITGDRDITTKPEAGEQIARGVPKGELTALSPAKHMGLIEHNDRFDTLVGAFVDSCQRPVATGGPAV
jgi:pimeloyl-ACP methyl ester carboxylesterase